MQSGLGESGRGSSENYCLYARKTRRIDTKKRNKGKMALSRDVTNLG